MLKELELLKVLLDDEVDVEALFKEPTEEQLFNRYYEKCTEIGIEEKIDKDSLREAVKEQVKTGGDIILDNVPDFEECDETPKTEVTLDLSDITLLQGILSSFSSKKITNKLIKNNVLKDLPGVHLVNDLHITQLEEELEKNRIKLTAKMFKDDPDNKMTFKVIK